MVLPGEKFVRKAHPFFWTVAVAVIPAALVGVTVEAQAPSWALRSVVVYRLEVGLAVFLVGYMVGLTLVNAYQGRSFGRLAFPGGEIDPADPNLAEASAGAEAFEEGVRESIQDLTNAIDATNSRVTTLAEKTGHDA